MFHLLPRTPSYTISVQKLTPECYSGHLFSLLPFSCAICLSSLFMRTFELENGEKSYAPHLLQSAHAMESPVLPVLKMELAGLCKVSTVKNSFFLACVINH